MKKARQPNQPLTTIPRYFLGLTDHRLEPSLHCGVHVYVNVCAYERIGNSVLNYFWLGVKVRVDVGGFGPLPRKIAEKRSMPERTNYVQISFIVLTLFRVP